MHILDFPLVRAADIGDEYESLLEERQHTDLFWKNSHACTERRKSHCCKPTSETNLKENSGQAEYDQLLLVQRLWGVQQSRKAANIKKKKKEICSSTAQHFPRGNEHWGLLEDIRWAMLHLKGIQHLCRCKCLVLLKHEIRHNRALTEVRKRAFLYMGYCIITCNTGRQPVSEAAHELGCPGTASLWLLLRSGAMEH